VKPLDLVVLHYTASPWQVPEKEEERVRRWGRGETRESSTHFVILRTGKVLQFMPLSDRAWHVVDKYKHEGRAINYRAVGIDFANVGYLTAQPDGTYRDYYGGRYLGPPPFIDADGKPWEPITAVQVDAARVLLRTLGDLFPVLRDPGRLIGHSDVQPTRRDPGPACPRWLLENALAGTA
jgi:N-acetyl-anhydromuramyl-L-alanine amidase AmpD